MFKRKDVEKEKEYKETRNKRNIGIEQQQITEGKLVSNEVACSGSLYYFTSLHYYYELKQKRER